MKASSLRFLAVMALGGILPSARADTNFGFTFVNASSGSAVMSTNLSWNDLRFTATKDVTVDQFALVVGSAVGDPRLRVSLQTDNAGNPSGTSLLSTVLAPGAMGAANLYGSFGGSVSLTQGNVYHLVMNVTNGSAANSLTLRTLTGADISNSPQTGAPDPSLMRLSSANSGSTWTGSPTQTNATVIVAAVGNSSNGDAVGQPISAAYNTYGVGATGTKGERFVWTGNTGDAVTSLTLRVWKGAGNAADNLNVLLLNSSLQVISSNLLLNAGFSTAAPSNYTITLSSPLVLTNGLTYNLVGQSAGSSANSYLLLAQGVPLTNMWDASFGGTNNFAITGTSGLASFAASSQTAGSTYDVWFNLGIASALPIPEPATLAAALLGLGALALRRRPRA